MTNLKIGVNGAIDQRIRNLALPAFLQSLVIASQYFLDTYFAAHFFASQVSIVYIAYSLGFVLNSSLYGIVLYIYPLAAANKEERREVLKQGVLAIITVFIPICILVALGNQFIASLFSTDMQIVQASSIYLTLTPINIGLRMIILCIGAVINASGKPRISLYLLASYVGCSVLISYLLASGILFPSHRSINYIIYGNSCVTLIFVIIYLIVFQRLHVKTKIVTSLSVTVKAILHMLHKASPIVFNGFLWSLSVFIYASLLSKTNSAAIALLNPIMTLSFTLYNGTGVAVNITLGKYFFRKKNKLARLTITSVLHKTMPSTVLMVTSLLLIAIPIFIFLAPQLFAQINLLYFVMIAIVWTRGVNIILINGVLRSFHDSSYILRLDTIASYLVGIPLCLLAYYYFAAPIAVLFILSFFEDFIKLFFCLKRSKYFFAKIPSQELS